MKKAVLLIAPLMILLAISCKNEPEKPKTTEELLDIASKAPGINAGTENYTISLPDQWTSKDTVINDIKFHFIFPPAEEGAFRVNVNIINEAMSGLSLEQYKQATIKNMTSLMQDFNLKEQGNFSTSDEKGAFMRYTIRQNNMDLEGILYIIPHNGIAYLMTGMAANDLDKYKATFDKIAQSFKFKD